jgi:DNA adenine methylase
VIAKPFLKWAGGKTALLHEILPRLPKKINTYYEPFVGGGAVYFALAWEDRFTHAVLSDSNRELIDTYQALRNSAKSVIAALSDHVYEEKHYYSVRSLEPRALDFYSRAARFIYLNRTCFNGLYRVNRKGAFNVPFGRYTNPTICDEALLRSVSKVLSRTGRASIQCKSFEDVVLNSRKGDAVYFDPPYVPASDTANFTSYTAGGFGLRNQEFLRDVVLKLVKRGVHVLLSNSDTPLVRKLYKGFKVERVEAPRRVNSKAEKRGNVGELLISGRWL